VIGRRCENPWYDRRGFTMVEVLLTLCLLAAVAVMCWPSFKDSFANQRLRAAANRVRAEWLRARAEAMNSDAVYVFRYTLGGSQFSVESRPDPDSIVEASLGDGMGGGGNFEDPSTRLRAFPGTLPDGIVFAASQIAHDVRADTVAAIDTSGQVPGEMDPIFFFPDGTATTAQLRLQNDRGRAIDLSLRGLTGVVTVGDVLASEELLR